MEPVKIKMSTFKADVESGMTRNELKQKYGLSLANIKEIAKKLGVEIKRDFKPKFELIDDTADVTESTVETEEEVKEGLNANIF